VYSVAKDQYTATPLVERWFRTHSAYYLADVKRVYYLSLEFMLGRALLCSVINLDARDAYTRAMRTLGYDLEEVHEQEWEAGLGNGGLGRLAACVQDSAAAPRPALLRVRHPLRVRHLPAAHPGRRAGGGPARLVSVRLGAAVEANREERVGPRDLPGVSVAQPVVRVRWVDAQEVWAMAYDTPVAGFRNGTVNTLRLWSAKSSREFDLARFNEGEYVRAVEDKTLSENIQGASRTCPRRSRSSSTTPTPCWPSPS
jgi:starch phosphorylase